MILSVRNTGFIGSLGKAFTITPNQLTFVESAPYTTGLFTASGSGTLYLTATAGGYVEVEWSINSGSYSFLYIFDGADDYPDGRSFAISDGDTLRFKMGGAADIGMTFRENDSSGVIKLTISGEFV